ncbi:TIM-barrel domain-containing protein [Pleionea mediterranea]|uniref:Oligosaccharide 4-alpha-D-glucosyltransferase n=1 Tax=Pleionea mediterranea TaxID=523701 RepID=A0A316G3L9_9GAMM|nr:TIM-barrel domain-containing protein [Pleionea mediterranea]PWK54380.1 oligosaccharide 4-alpha-D-glucosyltransferase [Pleionea mediterranea]
MYKLFQYFSVTVFVVLLLACTENTNKRHQLVLEKQSQRLILTAYDGAAIQVELVNTDHAQFPSFAVAASAKKSQPIIIHSNESVSFQINQLKAIVDKKTWQIEYYRNDEKLTAQTAFINKHRERQVDFSLADHEKVLGAGQRIVGMDRRGHRFPLYNRAHYGYTTESQQMYYSLPAIMSSNGYSIVFDNSAKGFLDIGKTDADRLRFESVGGRASYLIFAQQSFPELINSFVMVTGKQPMPARWLFGNHASRFGYRSQQQVEQVIKQYQQQDIPVDSVILDLFWFGPDIKGHVGNLDWDRNTFPEPEKMIESLKQQGVKTILITEPFVLTSSKRWQEAVDKKVCAKNEQGEPKRFDFYFGNTCLIDVFDRKAIDWFSGIYKDLMKQGVAGTWGDLGEPEVHPDDTLHTLSEYGLMARGDEIHNAYGHQWANMVYQSYREQQPQQRPLIMMRSGFIGSQRYGMIPWTGDVDRSWGGLKPQVELALQMSLFGLAYTHSDLGGFAGGESFDPELYIRWLQFGVFQPVYRPHAQDHIAPEPVFHEEITQSIVRDYIKLRYRLLPYHYTLAYQNSKTGMPLMRPLFFADKNNPVLFDKADSYFWGDAFLVAPVTEPGISKQSVYLPEGDWYDFWSDKRYAGEQTIDFPLTLNTMPVLVKAGSFVPMIESVSTTEHYSSDELILHYYALPRLHTLDAQPDLKNKLSSHNKTSLDDNTPGYASGYMYDDDGKRFGNIEQQRFEMLHFEATQIDDQLTLTFKRTPEVAENNSNVDGMNKQREHNATEPKEVALKKAVNTGADITAKGISAKNFTTKDTSAKDITAKGYKGMPKQRQMTLIIHGWQTEPSHIQFGQNRIENFNYNEEKQQLTIEFQWSHQAISLTVR